MCASKNIAKILGKGTSYQCFIFFCFFFCFFPFYHFPGSCDVEKKEDPKCTGGVLAGGELC